jgi:hypothetical protein
MNERDKKLEEALSSQLGVDGDNYIFTTKQVFLVRINLVILKLLMEDKNKKGVAIVLDRPHGYLAHLLALHRIDQSNLSYIDTVGKISENFTIDEPKKVVYTNGPFHVELLLNAFSEGYVDGEFKTKSIDLKDVDFILIDNIATALKYNTMESLELCIESLTSLCEKHGVLCVYGIDPKINKALYTLMKTYIKNEIKIDERWLRG